MLRPTDWIAQHLGLLTTLGKPCQGAVRFLSIDTRTLVRPSESLFFALHGTQRDGHDFLEKAYTLGVRNFVISKKIEAKNFPEGTFFLVKNTQAALQKVAAAHRKCFDIPTIGITGSNGKTIVKEWLFHALEKQYSIARSPASYNSQIGVPISIWQMDNSHNLAIIEAGISQQGEMAALAKIIQPSIGIFTNIGSAHEAGFEHKKQKVAEKMLLFEDCPLLIYPKEQHLINDAVMQWQKEKPSRACLYWTSEVDSEAALSMVRFKPARGKYTTISARTREGEQQTVRIPFTDKASIENALTCWLTLQHLGLSHRQIQRSLRALPPIQMRLEYKAGIHQCMLLNDSYNNDVTSLEIILAQAAKQANKQALTIILSDILQNKSAELYKDIADLLLRYNFQKVIGIGTAVKALRKHLPKQIAQGYFENTETFLDNIHTQGFDNELIVIKGARPFAFERIVYRLEQKVHRTVMEVNLNALRHNLNSYRKCLKPATKILVMVKAEGYGSGSERVAQLLEYQGVDYLGVAYADEGVELRKHGVQVPILVLNTDVSGFDALVRYDLEPDLFSMRHAQAMFEFCKKNKKKIRVHLKLETGMNRLGFEEKDLPELIDMLRASAKYIQVVSIFSHLAGSDDARFDTFTTAQAHRFELFSKKIITALHSIPNYPEPFRHLVNTAGIIRHPNLHYDMVRLGIGIYGVAAGAIPEKLQTVNTLKATISQIKTLQAGETIGYNRSGKVRSRRRIATVGIGYADGLLRMAGNEQYALFLHGQRAPILGNVCMDMCMIDVTDIPMAQVSDEVEVFGANLPVEALAKALQTIPYEVFTNISRRVPRLYVES